MDLASQTKLRLLLGASFLLYLPFFTFRPLSRHFLHESTPTPSSDYFYLAVVIILSLQMILYILSLRALERGGVDRKLLLGWAMVLGLCLSLVWPTSSNDHFQYLSHGRVFAVHHANPYLTPYLACHDRLADGLTTAWAGFPSPYGSLAVLVSALAVILGGNNLLATLLASKLIYFSLFAGSLVIISKACIDIRSFFLFAFNPLVLFELLINGHNELLAIAVLTCAVYAMNGEIGMRRGVMVYLIWYLSLFVKFIPILFLPFVWLYLVRCLTGTKQRLVFAAVTAALSAAIFFVVYVPFWSGPSSFSFPFINLSSLASRQKIFPPLSILMLWPVVQDLGQETLHALQQVASLFFAACFLVALAFFAKLRSITVGTLFLYISVTYALFLLFSPNYLPWYTCTGIFVWAVALARGASRALPTCCILIFTTLGILEYLVLR